MSPTTPADPRPERGRPAQAFDPRDVPIAVHTDSYKQTHPFMYEDAQHMAAYLEARGPFGGGDDRRLVHYGVQYLVERWLQRRWTLDDVERAAKFYRTFNAGFTPHPFPRELFERFVTENDGWFPVRVRALRDGTVIHARTPQVVLETEGDYARLCTWIEPLVLQSVWYMSTVATLSRRVVSDIRDAFERSADADAAWKLDSRFHDFGFRGCTCAEQAIMGGAAHLLSSRGTDTSPAAYYVQHHLNGGAPVASSIPASEHSVMTSFDDEADALRKIARLYADGVFATVADSYDYQHFLDALVPQVVNEVRSRGGFHVVRPDSGDPVACVVAGLHALERAYGADLNGKGYKVLRGAGVIQGDGIDPTVVRAILNATLEAGFSAENVAFGMGAGLLQKVNRDVLKYAMKLSHVTDVDGRERNVMKLPQTDPSKASFPGRFHVQRDTPDGPPRVYPEEAAPQPTNLLEVVYDHGPTGYMFERFDDVRARVDSEWSRMSRDGDPIDITLAEKRARAIAEIRGRG